MKNSGNYIPYLDGWRGLAIAAVFFGHFVAKAHYWWMGSFGVSLFFALSGFLMCNILFFKNTALPDFFARRLIRVAPTFVLFVLVITLYASTFQAVPYSPSSAEMLSTLLFLRSYLPSGSGIINNDWPIGHLWSLNVEEHTYMFLALMAFFARKIKRQWFTCTVLAAATGCSFFFSIHHYFHPPGGGTPGHLRSEAAALGIVAAVLLGYMKRTWPQYFCGRIPSWLPIASVLLAFACFMDFLRWRGVYLFIAPLCLAFTINYLDQVPAALIRFLSNERLGWLGKVSFSLYIWQQPFHFALCHYGLNAWLAVTLAISLGLLSFYGFENPLRIWLTRAWENRKLQAALLLSEEEDTLILR